MGVSFLNVNLPFRVQTPHSDLMPSRLALFSPQFHASARVLHTSSHMQDYKGN